MLILDLDMPMLNGIEVINFLLPRRKKYVTKSRYQNEQQSRVVESQLREWLDNEGYKYHYIDCPDSKRIETMLSILQETVGDLNGLSMV